VSALHEIAFYRKRRDEVPNQELAHRLARSRDLEGIAEIAGGLRDKNQSIQSDCLKVLYEIGYLEPELIADHVGEFLELLRSKNNRMVWGALIALATIARLKTGGIWARIDDVIAATGCGTVISRVWGVRILAELSAASRRYATRLFPLLLEQLGRARPVEIPRHVEDALVAVNRANREAFVAAIDARRPELSPSQRAKTDRLMRKAGLTA
jgi:hypothetical protein